MIPGNHDEFESYYRVDDPRIILCQDVVCVWISEPNIPLKEIWLSHYPMMTWPHRERGVYQFFGHIITGDEGVDRLPLIGTLDVGCDFVALARSTTIGKPKNKMDK